MASPTPIYGTADLIMVQQRMEDLPDGFWRSKFTRVITSDREEILFDLADDDDRRIAPFVSPIVAGRIMRLQGWYSRLFRPAYSKPKHVVRPDMAISRRLGEPMLGGSSIMERFNAATAECLRLERIYLERLFDWMAARAMIDGMVTVEGIDYPSRTVDFLRHADLTSALLGAATWDQTTADPLGDLAEMSDLAFMHGHAQITDLVFGTTAWTHFIRNEDVVNLLSTQLRGSTADFARTVLTQRENAQSMGFIDGPGGRFNLWRYSNWYSAESPEGVLTRTPYLDPRDVVGFGNAVDGIQMFGAILDASSLQPATIFPKMWEEQDPSAVFTMSQSAPLMVPTNPNNTFKLRVLA